MLLEGVKLMLVGMSVVFLFLILLNLSIGFFGKLISVLKLEKASGPSVSGKTTASKGDSGVPIAVIAAAIAAFRRDRKK